MHIRTVCYAAVSLFLAALVRPLPVAAQNPAGSGPLRVFLDCNTRVCDFDYFRTEVPFVDYVRDRTDATVHVLVTTQPTGGGGTEYTLNFIGRKEMVGTSDTLSYIAPNASTDDDRRKGIARTLKLGLVRYVARTPSGANLQITLAPPTATAAAAAAPTRDRWNYWVFRTRAGGRFNGESSQRFTNLNGSLSANRTTKEWKINTSLSGDYSESSFTFRGGDKFTSFSRSYGLSELVVRSLSDHWSAGQRASVTSSTFLNQKVAARFAPAVEYNFFPYNESTRRSLTLLYSVGVNAYRYRDTTIFEKLEEVRPDNSLVASLSLTQPWGSVNSSIEGAAFLDDLSKRRLVLFNSVNARLVKGLSLNLFGSVSLVRDQLYLRKLGATDEEILLQRRQLATSYRYFAGVSLTYTFGSIFNNVVNPRFEGSSGQIFFF